MAAFTPLYDLYVLHSDFFSGHQEMNKVFNFHFKVPL